MKKKIIIFGATGNTGSYLLEYALNFFNKEEYEIIASGRRNYFFFQKGNTILFCGHYEGRRF